MIANIIYVDNKPKSAYLLDLARFLINSAEDKGYLIAEPDKISKLVDVWVNFINRFIPESGKNCKIQANGWYVSEAEPFDVRIGETTIVEFNKGDIKDRIGYIAECSKTIENLELQRSPISDFLIESMQSDPEVKADTEFGLLCQQILKGCPRSKKQIINPEDFWEFFDYFDGQLAEKYLAESWGQFHTFLDRRVGRGAKRFSIYRKWTKIPYAERDLRKTASEKLLSEIASQYMGTILGGINCAIANLIGLKQEPREAINFLLTFYAYTKYDKNKQLVEKSYDDFLKIHRENQARYI